jgi:hypothetical protein
MKGGPCVYGHARPRPGFGERGGTPEPRRILPRTPARPAASLCGSVRRSRVATTDDRSRSEAKFAPFPLDVAAVWALFSVVAAEILVTYSRLPARELYHVSRSGLTAGASRALVFLNFPLALVAIPILAFLSQRLASRSA